MKRHYVSAYHRKDHTPVRSYVRGHDFSYFPDDKKPIPDYLTQFNILEAESKKLEDERYEEEMLRINAEADEREKAIRDYTSEEFANAREAFEYKVQELWDLDEKEAQLRLEAYKKIFEELEKLKKDSGEK